MLYGLYLSAAGMQAQEKRQAVLTNNLANAQTTGFKRDLTVMQSRLNEAKEHGAAAQYQVPVLENQGGGVTLGGTVVDLSQGSFKRTDEPGDMALSGRGFFTVQGAQGQKLLTRDGQFMVNEQGTLVTASGGNAVLGADGMAITVKPGVDVTIDEQGVVSQKGQAAGKLGLADVTDARRLVKLGGNLLTVDDPKALVAAPVQTGVKQGFLEESGADPMVEMVTMMEGQRAFEANAKMITYQDTTLQEVNTIGRVA